VDLWPRFSSSADNAGLSIGSLQPLLDVLKSLPLGIGEDIGAINTLHNAAACLSQYRINGNFTMFPALGFIQQDETMLQVIVNAEDMMTPKSVTVDSTSTAQDAADLKVAADICHLPVVTHGTLVGMISDRDLRSYMLPRSEKAFHADEARAQHWRIDRDGQLC
jgi:CBS domain-containing protein